MIPFNKPYYTKSCKELALKTLDKGHLSGDGLFTKKVTNFFNKKFKFKYCLTTTSCTDALELIALTIGIKPGDEVIIPSYTFVSTVNPFLLRGAKVVFADSNENNPNINLDEVKKLINKKTKALVIVHYGGSGFDLIKLNGIRDLFPKLIIIEDAAQCINSHYMDIALGSFGDYAAFSFHQTKNISCGEGGLFVCKDEDNLKKAEIIREKGTNRTSFYRGEVDKYGWKNLGSSFLPSDLLMAILFSQLKNLNEIHTQRINQWDYYFKKLKELKDKINLPEIDINSNHNGHIFYIVLNSELQRDKLIKYLSKKKIKSTFHYSSLNNSKFFIEEYKNNILNLKNSNKFSKQLLRLPLYHELKFEQIDTVVNSIFDFFDLSKEH